MDLEPSENDSAATTFDSSKPLTLSVQAPSSGVRKIDHFTRCRLTTPPVTPVSQKVSGQNATGKKATGKKRYGIKRHGEKRPRDKMPRGENAMGNTRRGDIGTAMDAQIRVLNDLSCRISLMVVVVIK